MREILFRGIDKSTCKWVYGDLLQRDFNKTIKAIMQPFPNTKSVVVKDYTVGQYTGLTDKNGNKIFEGDIVKNEYSVHKYQYFVIKWDDKLYCWLLENKYKWATKLYSIIGTVEIIGNIHDNPELLKMDGEK